MHMLCLITYYKASVKICNRNCNAFLQVVEDLITNLQRNRFLFTQTLKYTEALFHNNRFSFSSFQNPFKHTAADRSESLHFVNNQVSTFIYMIRTLINTLF